MDLPITRPSMICYADEIEFPELLKKLSENKHNGFIRITAGSDEGFILFKQGKEIAASYDRHARVEAIEKIRNAMGDETTLIETFDVRETQIDFFMDMNKPYIIGSEAYHVIDELKKSQDLKDNLPEPEPQPKAVPQPKPVSEALKSDMLENNTLNEVSSNSVESTETSTNNGTKIGTSEKVNETDKVKSESLINSQSKKSSIAENSGYVKEIENKADIIKLKEKEIETDDASTISESVEKSNENESELNNSSAESSTTNENFTKDLNNKSELNDQGAETENAEMPPMDRSELMKKYGIKDIQDEDVDNILESYKGGSVSDEDIEKIELTLMNKIKKSILGIPKIRGAEVMVFLENFDELTGKVNIIIDLESKGFLSRIRGESKDIKLERQIIDMSQIEIKKSFRKYPEIVDQFEVNVEIS